MSSRKVLKYAIDGTVIDSNRSIDFKDTVNMQKNAKKLDLISLFYSQFPLTHVNFMSHNLTRPIIRVNFMVLLFLFKKRVISMRASFMNFRTHQFSVIRHLTRLKFGDRF